MELEAILRKASEMLTPSPEEKKRALKALNEAVKLLEGAAKELSLQVSVVPVGSITRDTWLPGKTDLDIFVLFERSFPEKKLEEAIIEMAETAFGSYILRYSAHPYARVEYKGFEMDVVPAYRVREATELKTPVDRSPLHSKFLEERMTPELAREARLMKAFVKGIRAYGAEVRVEGFSGYLCELLVLYYGSFLETIRSAIKWDEPVVIDILGSIPSEQEAIKLFQHPLIVIDPVDPRRNVASALSRTQFYRFKAAARAFLKRPSLEFFKERQDEEKEPSISNLLRERRSFIAAIAFEGVKEPPDTLWTQAKSCSRRIMRILRDREFEPIQVEGFTDERSRVMILIEVPSRKISEVKIRVGPEVGRKGELDFIRKHIGAEDTISGPFIRENRWIVLKKRRENDLMSLLSCFIKKGEGIPRKLLKAPIKEVKPLEEMKIPDWAIDFLKKFLKKEEPFIKELADP